MRAKKLKRILATVLAMALIGTSVPMDALASEGTKVVSEEDEIELETKQSEEDGIELETKQSEEENAVSETDTEQNETESSDVIATGVCGENITWTLTEDYALTVSGTGEIPDTGSVEVWDWDSYCEQIRKITIEEGITYIGNYAFDGMILLEEIEVAGSVTIIGEYAFYGFENLKKLTLNEGVTQIKKYAFSGDYYTSTPEIYFPSSVTYVWAGAFDDIQASKLYISDLNAWCNIYFSDAGAQ